MKEYESIYKWTIIVGMADTISVACWLKTNNNCLFQKNGNIGLLLINLLVPLYTHFAYIIYKVNLSRSDMSSEAMAKGVARG